MNHEKLSKRVNYKPITKEKKSLEEFASIKNTQIVTITNNFNESFKSHLDDTFSEH